MHHKKNDNQIVLDHATIDGLSHDGRGIAHIQNKITFLENALPGEEVNFRYIKKHSKFNTGYAVEILHPSPERVAPLCQHYHLCGGCTLQHLNHTQQLKLKTLALQEQLQHIAGLTPNTYDITPPITGTTYAYRSKARLSVKYVTKKQRLLVGFHEKNTRYVVDTTVCHILHPSIGEKISLLRELIAALSIYQSIPQIEVACGDKTTALVLRNLQKFSAADLTLISDFGAKHQLQIYAQPGGIESITPISSEQAAISLDYELPPQITMTFVPTDFTQINQVINCQMVSQVLQLLAIEAGEKVLDLFCGIGNFTLPIASKGAIVTGVEGSNHAVLRAQRNAAENNLAHAEFYVADLTKELTGAPWSMQQYTKILLDPPRTGAPEILAQIKKFGAKKIVYVSCNPATFARDTKIILEHGYNLEKVTLADMYPQTSHIEIVASFTLASKL